MCFSLAAGVAHDGRQGLGEATRAAWREMALVDEVGGDKRLRWHADIDVAQLLRRALEDGIELLLQGPEIAVAHQGQPAIEALAGEPLAIEELTHPDRHHTALAVDGRDRANV